MSENGTPKMQDDNLLTHTADIIAAYLSNNSIPSGDVPGLILSVHTTLQETCKAANGEPAPTPKVSVKQSIKPDKIVCLECGKDYKTLKRHIRSYHDLTPEDYRRRWNLPEVYPMVAPNYTKARSQIAKDIGLGHQR